MWDDTLFVRKETTQPVPFGRRRGQKHLLPPARRCLRGGGAEQGWGVLRGGSAAACSLSLLPSAELSLPAPADNNQGNGEQTPAQPRGHPKHPARAHQCSGPALGIDFPKKSSLDMKLDLAVSGCAALYEVAAAARFLGSSACCICARMTAAGLRRCHPGAPWSSASSVPHSRTGIIRCSSSHRHGNESGNSCPKNRLKKILAGCENQLQAARGDGRARPSCQQAPTSFLPSSV